MGEDVQLLEESLHLLVFCSEKPQVHFPAEGGRNSSLEPRFCLGREGKLKCFQIEIGVMRCYLKDWDGTPRISRCSPLHQLIQFLPDRPRGWPLWEGLGRRCLHSPLSPSGSPLQCSTLRNFLCSVAATHSKHLVLPGDLAFVKWICSDTVEILMCSAVF